MKIVVINGSPKGEKSISLHYARYIQKRFPQHEYSEYLVAQRTHVLERDEARFQIVMDDMAAADLILWAFPLYYMLVHSGLKRFVELLFERGASERLQGKAAAILSTSIHYCDHTAHNYLWGISEDLGMTVVGELAADSSDLFKEEGRQQLDHFAQTVFGLAEEGRPLVRQTAPLTRSDWTYMLISAVMPVEAWGKRVAIIHDALPQEANLLAMVERLSRVYVGKAQVINLRDVPMHPCLGCIRCGQQNECAYDRTAKAEGGTGDGHRQLYETLKGMDVILWAGTIHDRYLSYHWKMFYDRAFYNGHVPSLKGKQFVWVISGPISQLANLREVFKAYGEMQESNLVGIVSDEVGDAARLDLLLDGAARDAIAAARNVIPPATSFRGLAGRLLFRDEIWGHLRAVFRADHQYYKRHGVYDSFPQRHIGVRLLNTFLPPLLRIPKLRKAMQDGTVDSMVGRHTRIVDETQPAEA